MPVFKKTKQGQSRPEKTSVFKFPENVSMKSVGDFIEGIYQGCLIKSGEGLNGADLVLAAFLQEDNSIKTCVAGSQLQKFLESYQQGYYLKVIRSDTLKITGDRKFAMYTFELDNAGLKEANEINFIDASAIPQTRQLKV